jgi:hypothetical protein
MTAELKLKQPDWMLVVDAQTINTIKCSLLQVLVSALRQELVFAPSQVLGCAPSQVLVLTITRV